MVTSVQFHYLSVKYPVLHTTWCDGDDEYNLISTPGFTEKDRESEGLTEGGLN